jgi:uroporphyrinogen decarboxylase
MAALNVEPVDRPPFALWRHFPGAEQTAEELARAHADWQTLHQFDFVKITPPSGYSIEDWGVQFDYSATPDAHGTRRQRNHPIASADDLVRLRPTNPLAGALGRQLEVVRLLRDLVPDVMLWQTVFSPLHSLSGLMGDRLLPAITHSPEYVRTALHAISASTLEFAEACLEQGCDAIFYATKMASTSMLSADAYREWALAVDTRLVEAMARHGPVILHAHGDRLHWDVLYRYPAQALNWHDRAGHLSLAEARSAFPGALAGGLSADTLAANDVHAAQMEVSDGLRQTGGRGWVVAAGCVTPLTTRSQTIQTVRGALEQLKYQLTHA